MRRCHAALYMYSLIMHGYGPEGSKSRGKKRCTFWFTAGRLALSFCLACCFCGGGALSADGAGGTGGGVGGGGDV